ncbi:MAG: hypothetical protein ABFD00_04075 [Chloroherpetonaceae bacterium]
MQQFVKINANKDIVPFTENLSAGELDIQLVKRSENDEIKENIKFYGFSIK